MFHMGLRKSVLVSATTILALAGGLAVAAPAEAESKCTGRGQNEKTIPLPGKPDVWVGITLCVNRTSAGNGHAFANINWDGSFLGGTRFDKFVLQVRLERADTPIATVNCDFRSALNGRIEGSGDCGGATRTSTARGRWSADGKVTYNVNNDGQGNKTWDLQGSPEVD